MYGWLLPRAPSTALGGCCELATAAAITVLVLPIVTIVAPGRLWISILLGGIGLAFAFGKTHLSSFIMGAFLLYAYLLVIFMRVLVVFDLAHKRFCLRYF